MRKIRIILIVVAVLLTMGACAGSGAGDMRDMPDWFLNTPSVADAFYGVGTYKSSNLGTAKTMAMANARNDIAFQVEAKVQSVIKQYAQEAGVDGKKQTIEFVETISKQIANTTLQGAKVESTYLAKDDTFFVLMVYPVNALATELKSQENFIRSQDAAFAEWKAENAFEDLQQDMKDNPSEAGNIK